MRRLMLFVCLLPLTLSLGCQAVPDLLDDLLVIEENTDRWADACLSGEIPPQPAEFAPHEILITSMPLRAITEGTSISTDIEVGVLNHPDALFELDLGYRVYAPEGLVVRTDDIGADGYAPGGRGSGISGDLHLGLLRGCDGLWLPIEIFGAEAGTFELQVEIVGLETGDILESIVRRVEVLPRG